MVLENKSILCVDDEVNILQSLKRLLRKEPYKLFVANSGKEGLEIMKNNPIQIVLSDQRMPEMTGCDFLKEVKALYPNTVRVVLSGYADVGVIVESINQGEIYRFLTKPWNDEELKANIRQCFEQYEMRCENIRLLKTVQEQNDALIQLNENLEDTVRERTLCLQLAQDIFYDLPVPVIALSRELELMIVNSQAVRRFPQLASVFPGTVVSELFCKNIMTVINECISTEVNITVDVDFLGVDVSATFTLLKADESVRGIVITIVI